MLNYQLIGVSFQFTYFKYIGPRTSCSVLVYTVTICSAQLILIQANNEDCSDQTTQTALIRLQEEPWAFAVRVYARLIYRVTLHTNVNIYA